MVFQKGFNYLFDRATAMSWSPPGGSLRDDYSEYDCLCTFILILHVQHHSLCVCVCVLGCSWKERAHTSVRSPAWCLKHRSESWCGTQFCPGPSSARSSGTPGSSLDPSLTWTPSTRTRPSSSPSNSLTPSVLPVRYQSCLSPVCPL